VVYMGRGQEAEEVSSQQVPRQSSQAKARVARVGGTGLAGMGKIGQGLGKLSCMALMPSIAGMQRVSSTSCLHMCPHTTNMCPHTATDALYFGYATSVLNQQPIYMCPHTTTNMCPHTTTTTICVYMH